MSASVEQEPLRVIETRVGAFAVAICPLCNGLLPPEKRGEYKKTATHRLCAVEQKLEDAEKEIEKQAAQIKELSHMQPA